MKIITVRTALFWVSLIFLSGSALAQSGSGTAGQSQWIDLYDRQGVLNVVGDQLTGTLGSTTRGSITITGELTATSAGLIYAELATSSDGFLLTGWTQGGDYPSCGPDSASSGLIRLLFNAAGTSFTGSHRGCTTAGGVPITHDHLSETSDSYTGNLTSGALDFSGVPDAVAWQSKWANNYNQKLVFNIVGDQFTGINTASNSTYAGQLTARIDGVLLTGWYKRSSSNGSCGPDNAWSGLIKLLFTTAGTSYTGSSGGCTSTHDNISETSSNSTGSLTGGALDFSGVPSASSNSGNTNTVPDVNSFLVVESKSTQSAVANVDNGVWNTASITLALDPADNTWIGWSNQTSLAAYAGTNASRAGEGVIIGLVDDSMNITVTNPAGESLTVRFNDNSAFGNATASVSQNILYGTSAAAPDAFSVSPSYGSPPNAESLLDESGPFAALFTGAGNYTFKFDFVNVYTLLAGHPNVYLLTDGPATVVTDGGSGGATGPDLSAISAKADLNWSSNGTAGYTWSTPIILSDRVILQDQDGGLDAYNKTDGSRIYYKDLANASPTNSPIFSNGHIYMIAGGLLKVDPADGSIVKSFTGVSISSQSPAVYKELIFIGADSKIYALNINTMQTVWSMPLSSGDINVAVKDDILYVFNKSITAFDPSTGSQLWNVASPDGNSLSVGSVAAGYLSVFENGSLDSQLHTFSLNSDLKLAPTLKWSANMGNNLADRSPPAMDNLNVYGVGREGVLRAFTLNGSGTPLWELKVRDSGSAPALPMATGGMVFVQAVQSDNSLQLVGLNGATGAQILKTQIPNMGIGWGSPTKKDGVVYFSSDLHGTLYSIAVDAKIGGDWEMIKGNAQLTGSSTAGLVSAVDASTLTIDLPQMYAAGVGVFATKLTLVDVAAMKFHMNESEAVTVNVISSAIATFDIATQQLNIPKLFFNGVSYDVTFGLTGSSGYNHEFTVIAIK
jgi:hypothetical protein